MNITSSEVTIDLLMKAYARLLERIETVHETVKETKETKTTLDYRVSTLVHNWFENKGEISPRIPY